MNADLRRTVYTLLTIVTIAAATARVLAAERVYEPSLHRPEPGGSSSASLWPRARPAPTPMFSSNDRSRWATVRALVDEGTFAIGKREYDAAGRYRDSGIIFEDGWQSVDKVLDPVTKQFYSSKPPLLSVLLAGEYRVLQEITGWTLKDDPRKVVGTILLTVNVLGFAVYLTLLARLLERFGTTDWGRLFTFAAACFGTFLTTFLTTLNNHTPAAVTALVAVYPILTDERLSTRSLLVSGIFAGLTAAFELPATAMLAGLAVGVAIVAFERRRAGGHDSSPLAPASGERGGGEGAALSSPTDAANRGGWFSPSPPPLSPKAGARGARRVAPAVGLALATFVPAALLPVVLQLGLNYAAVGDWKPVYEKVESEWYRYEGSHWNKTGAERRGIDFAGDRESRPVYAFHLLLGHHGVFSLTPIWLLSAAGLAHTLAGRRDFGNRWAQVMLLTVGVSVVVLVFFAAVTGTVNYGGWTSGPRWFFWLTPLWLLALLPAADRLADGTGGRALGYVLLGVSVFSASYPAWNPWRHPWIYQLLENWGWVRY